MRAGSLTRNWPKVLALVVFSVGLAWALYQPPAQAKQTINHAELFRQKVKPIFEQNCNFCHGGAVQRSGLDLRSEDAILRGGTRGAGVVPGAPAQSLLYKLITHAEEPAMPMGSGKLSAEGVAVVAQWIEPLPAACAAEGIARAIRREKDEDKMPSTDCATSTALAP